MTVYNIYFIAYRFTADPKDPKFSALVAGYGLTDTENALKEELAKAGVPTEHYLTCSIEPQHGESSLVRGVIEHEPDMKARRDKKHNAA